MHCQMTFIIGRDIAAVKILKNRRDLLSRISIRFRMHIWFGCSIPRGCFYDKCVGVPVPVRALKHQLIQLLTDTENKSTHGKNKSAFALF